MAIPDFLAFFQNVNTPSVNVNYAHLTTAPGVLQGLQMVNGLLCFILALASNSGYYDPWLQRSVSGFGGGKAETAFLLIVYSCLFCSTLLLISNLTVLPSTSSLLVKGTFDLIFNSMSAVLYLLTSLVMLVEVMARNERMIHSEPGYKAKVVAGTLGLLNGLFYFIGGILSYRTGNFQT